MSEYLDTSAPMILKRRGHEIYTIDGETVVDEVCRFERLAEDMEGVRKRLGLPEALAMPSSKSKFRKDKRSYRDILGEREAAKIAELFREEIQLFGYEF